MLKHILMAFCCLSLTVVFLSGCGGGGGGSAAVVAVPIVVNSLEDPLVPAQGVITLRSALAAATSGQPIIFASNLDGGVISLTNVGEGSTELKGEVMDMRIEPSGPVSFLVGYLARDYGASALYARKNVVIDASALPNGITVEWAGATDARVLAVYGNLNMTNVNITGGSSVAIDISATNASQPWTLGRGGGVAVWGTAELVGCKIYGNSCQGDFDSSRDRGAFGGGLYADIVILNDCVISGNTVLGGGAAGGGVYSVGGADTTATQSTITQCTISGNKISALFTYGGGVYSDGGGIGNRKLLHLTNCTVARNLVEPPPGMPAFLLGMGYWRGGAVYASNGSVMIDACTIVENEVIGLPRTDSLDRPNLAGGVACTVGNAHAVEELTVAQSIFAGNMVRELNGGGAIANSYNQDIFTGSLMYFISRGYNRVGVIQFSHILVPVGEPGWKSLCRRHFPKTGDTQNVAVNTVLDVANPVTEATITSQGVDASGPAVISYTPIGAAVDQIPATPYGIDRTTAEYEYTGAGTDRFLTIFLDRVEDHFSLSDFATPYTTDFVNFLNSVDADEDTTGVQPYEDPDGNPIISMDRTLWYGPAVTWPKELPNYPYIEFWHRLDNALVAESIPGLGQEILGDDEWKAMFTSGPLAEDNDIVMTVTTEDYLAVLEDLDQTGNTRPVNSLGDIGAIENR